ncbi:TadE family protein [Streptomyces sp. NPDC047043]|uniref:TadE family protein n=1 Tax=Streptomyces sp. NPDC047043 TaxID=3154497 RepID=UPI0033DD46E2
MTLTETGRRQDALPRPAPGRIRDDSGASSTEMVIIMPVLLTIVLLLAQATIWWHAVHIAQVTASDALAVSRVENGTAVGGQNEAQRVLDQLGRGPLRGTHVTITRTADGAEVRITGTATSVVPFLHLPVRTHVSGPVEQFRPGGQAGP